MLDFDQFPDLKYTWAGTHHFFDASRYYSNYLFAWVLAIAVNERLDADPLFAEKFVKLMKAGFSNDPISLLRTQLGIDLADPRGWGGCDDHIVSLQLLLNDENEPNWGAVAKSNNERTPCVALSVLARRSCSVGSMRKYAISCAHVHGGTNRCLWPGNGCFIWVECECS